MEFYTRDLKRVDLDVNFQSLINSGSFSNVYKSNDLAVKLYNDYSNWTNNPMMTEKKFDRISSVKSDNFIELHDLIMKTDDNDIVKGIKGKNFRIDGYTARYYEADNKNPMYKPSSYFISNIVSLQDLIEELTQKGIILNDVDVPNTILTKDNIVIIDPDLYDITLDLSDIFCRFAISELKGERHSTKKIKLSNAYEILWLIRLLMYEHSSELKDDVLKYFDEFNGYNSIDCIEQVKKDLCRVRTPIEMFERRR